MHHTSNFLWAYHSHTLHCTHICTLYNYIGFGLLPQLLPSTVNYSQVYLLRAVQKLHQHSSLRHAVYNIDMYQNKTKLNSVGKKARGTYSQVPPTRVEWHASVDTRGTSAVTPLKPLDKTNKSSNELIRSLSALTLGGTNCLLLPECQWG